MSAPNYRIQKQNATAVNLLRSWLKAVGIVNRPSTVPGFDLVVEGRLGDVQVQVAMRAPETMPDESGVQVMAKAFTGKKISRALEAFYKITDTAGYDRQRPVDRGAEPAANEKGNPRKLHYKDEPFLVPIRHTEFRRAPNPSADRWKHYQSTMEKVSWAFIRSNFELCTRHGLDIHDVMQTARCLMVNFCSRYETPDEVFHDNERKFYVYLQQRLNRGGSSLRETLLKAERSMMPDAETVSIALYGTPDSEAEVSPDTAIEEVDYDYIAKHCELDISSPKARRESVIKILAELLGKMPHDQMVEVLKSKSKDPKCDFITRKEASRQLRVHAEKCAECLPGDLGLEVNEEPAGGDALGAPSEV